MSKAVIEITSTGEGDKVNIEVSFNGETLQRLGRLPQSAGSANGISPRMGCMPQSAGSANGTDKQREITNG